MDWEYLLFILLGYFSGSVLYARLLPRLLKGVDVTRQSGDGNPGTANAIQLAGWPVGLLSLGLELAKGAVPVFLAARHLDMSQTAFALVLAAPALGHAFPFGRFTKGGKAIAVSFGCLLGLLPLWQPWPCWRGCTYSSRWCWWYPPPLPQRAGLRPFGRRLLPFEAARPCDPGLLPAFRPGHPAASPPLPGGKAGRPAV